MFNYKFPYLNKVNLYIIFALVMILMLALLIRIHPVIKSPEKCRHGIGIFGDTHLYHRIAYNLYKGNGFSGTDDGRAYGSRQANKNLEYEPVITRGPVYPFFIYTIYKFFGKEKDMHSIETWHRNWDKVRIAQCILDATISLLVFFIVRLIYPATFWPALISAMLYCFSFYNIYYTKALLSESTTTFFLTCALWFSLLALKFEKKYLWFLTGIGFGIVLLSRPEYALFPLFLSAYIYFLKRKLLIDALKKIVLFLIGIGIILTPWTLRNYLICKEPIMVSRGPIGYSLYLGSFVTPKNWKGWFNFPQEIFKNRQEKEAIEYLSLLHNYYYFRGSKKMIEIDNIFLELALERIKDNPSQYFWHYIKKAPRLWYQNYMHMSLYKEASGNFFVFYFVFALFAFGLSTRKEKVFMAPVGLFFVYLNVIFLPLAISPRYGVVLIPGIISLTGIGIWKIFLWLKINVKNRTKDIHFIYP